MSLHHVALATKDLPATNVFYTQHTGFTLDRVEALPTPSGQGWAKHAFYNTGDGSFIAFWELHDPTIANTWSPAISEGLGLPVWVNHIAFGATDSQDLVNRRERWRSFGHHVAEVDHGWCHSIYTQDPNGIAVEFCLTVSEASQRDRDNAQITLSAEAPSLVTTKRPILHLPI